MQLRVLSLLPLNTYIQEKSFVRVTCYCRNSMNSCEDAGHVFKSYQSDIRSVKQPTITSKADLFSREESGDTQQWENRQKLHYMKTDDSGRQKKLACSNSLQGLKCSVNQWMILVFKCFLL